MFLPGSGCRRGCSKICAPTPRKARSISAVRGSLCEPPTWSLEEPRELPPETSAERCTSCPHGRSCTKQTHTRVRGLHRKNVEQARVQTLIQGTSASHLTNSKISENHSLVTDSVLNELYDRIITTKLMMALAQRNNNLLQTKPNPA